MGETKVKDLPAHRRPRERLFNHGCRHLSDPQLLAIIIGSGTANLNAISLARKIINRYRLAKLAKITPAQLTKITGIGQATAARILAAVELGARAVKTETNTPVVTTPQDVLLLTARLDSYRQEHLLVLYLDSRHQLLKRVTIAVGSLNTTLVHPREIFAPALNLPAASIILVHNHPTGRASPSEDDTRFTKRIVQAGKIIGIELIDHLIVGGGSYFSFREADLI